MTDLQVSGRNITVSGAGDTVIWFNAFAEESAGLRAKLTESGIGGCTLVTVDVPDWDAALSPWQAEALSMKKTDTPRKERELCRKNPEKIMSPTQS